MLLIMPEACGYKVSIIGRHRHHRSVGSVGLLPQTDLAPDLLSIKLMENSRQHHPLWSGVPPWIFIGAVVVLLPLFGYMTYETIRRQKENSVRMLMEKGAALTRSFEAGTRTGVMGTHWDSFQLQRLLTETALQPDIVYLLVTNSRGQIIAHNDPAQIGKRYGRELDLSELTRTETVIGREVVFPNDQKVFEIASRFMPSGPPVGMSPGQQQFMARFQALLESLNIPPSDMWIIFIGLDMSTIEKATRADMQHSIVMGAILLLLGFSGVVFLFLTQGYRSARASLSRIKAFSDNLVENMPMGLVALDREKAIAMMNQTAGSILQLSVPEARGKSAAEFLPPPLGLQIEELMEKERLVDHQIECRLADNRKVPLEVNATRIYDEGGTVFGYVLLLKDMSEVASLRKEVARSQRLATVGRLAGGVAHEIRNPLSSIKGFATYFKERYADNAEDQRIAGIMIQEVDKLNRVVGQLLEFARPIQILKKWAPIRPLVEDALKLIEQKAEKEHISIQTEFSPEIELAHIDPDRINQVLLNLFLNAAEAMPNGGELNVKIEKAPDGTGMLCRIADSGVGIEAADIPHIFDPYYTTKPAGTGLGLAIVHNIIEAHEGGIRVESGPKSGTVITLFLPQPERAIAVREEEP
jgi:two-component system, NtrC family, sensor histidine kinase HydH